MPTIKLKLGNRAFRVDRILGVTLLTVLFAWLFYWQHFVPHPQLPWWDTGDYALPSDVDPVHRVVAASETVGGPVVLFNSDIAPVPSEQAEQFLSAEIKSLEARRDKLLEEIHKLRGEILELQQVRIDQVKLIAAVIDQSAARERYLNFILGFLTGLFVEFLLLNKHVRRWFIEENLAAGELKTNRS